MRSRAELVTELVRNPLADDSILDDLRFFGWQCESELIEVSRADVLAVLDSFRHGELSAEQVQRWAKRIENRDDVGFELSGEGVVNEAVFWLANPYLNWPIDVELCDRITLCFSQS